MNINKSVIEKLKNSNAKVASLFEKLNDLTAEQIIALDLELKKLNEHKGVSTKKPKKTESIVENETKLLSTITSITTDLTKSAKAIKKEKQLSSQLIGELVVTKNTSTKKTTNSPMSSMEISLPKFSNIKIKGNIQQKESQSKDDFLVDTVSPEQEKLDLMKKIDKNLSFKTSNKEMSSPKDSSGSLFEGIGGLLSMGAGFMKSGAGKVGKAFGLINAALSIKELFSTIKGGYTGYKALRAKGDNVSASNLLLKTIVNGSGNLMNIVGGVMPGPIGWALMGGGTLFERMADEFDSVWSDKSDKIIQDQQKVANIEDMIAQGEKNNILQIRPGNNYTIWEYKDYISDEWKPIIDEATGKALSMKAGHDKLVRPPSSTDGIQRYKLQTGSSGLVDIVMKNGKPMMVVNDKPTVISTRANGGSVSKNKKYLVGERGPERYLGKTPANLQKLFDTYSFAVLDANVHAVNEFVRLSKQMGSTRLPDTDVKFEPFSFSDVGRSIKQEIASSAPSDMTKILPTQTGPAVTTPMTGYDINWSSRVDPKVREALLSLPEDVRLFGIRNVGSESAFKANAAAKTASAQGIFQFTAGTWKEEVRRQGLNYTADDRNDPMKAATVYPEYIRRRKNKIQKMIGREPSELEVYMAAFGEGYAAPIIRQYYVDPNATIDTVLSKKSQDTLYKTNRASFYNSKANRWKTISEFYTDVGGQFYRNNGAEIIPKYELGTMRVPKSGPALLHQGEIVVPEKNARKIRSAIHSNQRISTPINESVADIDEDFYINTLVNAMADVVKKEYLRTHE